MQSALDPTSLIESGILQVQRPPLSLTGKGGRENYKDIEIRAGEGTKGFLMEVWGNSPDIFNLSVRSPGGETIPAARIGTGQGITYGFIFEDTKVTIDSVLVEQGTGEELILLRFQNPTPCIWTLRVTAIGQVYSGTFHAWLPITHLKLEQKGKKKLYILTKR